jgi:hypothetical protein
MNSADASHSGVATEGTGALAVTTAVIAAIVTNRVKTRTRRWRPRP